MLCEGPFWVPLLFLRHYISFTDCKSSETPQKNINNRSTTDCIPQLSQPKRDWIHNMTSYSLIGTLIGLIPQHSVPLVELTQTEITDRTHKLGSQLARWGSRRY